MTEAIVSIVAVVVLPALIVWLITRVRINSENRRSEVLLEAMRQGSTIDTDRLSEFFARENRTSAELLNLRLLRGCIFTLLGVAFGIIVMVMAICGSADMDDILGPAVISAIALAIGLGYLIVYFVSRPKKDK